MKLFKSIFVVALSVAVLASCGGQTSKKYEGISQSQLDSASYAIGVSLGQMIKGSGIDAVNYGKILSGLKDVVSGSEVKISDEEIGQVINAYIVKLGEAHAAEADAKEAKFFAENKTKEGVQETESGLQYQIIDAGNPDLIPGEMDTVQVNYKGIVLGGTKEFDSTYQRGEPATFPVNRVVPGWSEGIKLIGEGGKIKLWIPYKLGYGANAASPDLPGYSTLVFDVELLKVTPYVEKDEKVAKKL